MATVHFAGWGSVKAIDQPARAREWPPIVLHTFAINFSVLWFRSTMPPTDKERAAVEPRKGGKVVSKLSSALLVQR
jgi:hypothetical protein